MKTLTATIIILLTFTLTAPFNTQADKKLISEEYVIKQFETQFVDKISHILSSMGCWRALGKTSDKTWKRDNHEWLISDDKDAQKRNRMWFRNYRYDPDSSKISYGKARIVKTDKKVPQGFSREFDNRGSGEPSNETISQEITLAQSVEHSINTGVETSVKSSTTVSGTYSGVSFEQQVETSFGFKLDKSKTESQSKEVKDTITDEFTVPAGKRYLVTFNKDVIREETPFSVDGHLDCDIEIDMENWPGGALSDLWKSGNLKDANIKRSGKKYKGTLKFDSLLAFERFIKGYDVRFPRMRDFLKRAPKKTQDAANWIFNINNRKVEFDGVKKREYDDNITITRTEVK